MHTLKSELGKLNDVRKAFEWLCDGEPDAAAILIFIKGNYKEWAAIMTWMRENRIRGKGMVQLFQNESPDGGGYHMGVTFILSRIKGHKFSVEGIKVNELL